MILPLHEPLLIFTVIIGIILLSPFFFRLFKIPDIASFIIMGVLVGPYGFNVLTRDSSIELLGTIGLLYIMFIAGLELDSEKLKGSLRNSVVFGLSTFLVPFVLGYAISKYLLQLENMAAFMVSIMFSTHTLIAYPIARKLGANRDISVLTAVGGTIITDTLVLLILSIVTQDFSDNSGNFKIAMLLILFFLYALFIFYTFPRIARWFFKHIKRDRPVHYLFLLFMVCLSSYIAELIGTEPIIGAFIAGMALNKSIPKNSLLMHHIDFVGNVLFIPVFLIGTGMLINTRLLFSESYLWYVSIILIFTAFTGKWIAAFITQKIVKFSGTQRNLLFGLTCSHAAATIAIILIGYEKHMIDVTIFNATVIVILTSSLAASFITEKSGKKLVLASDFSDETNPFERILVPISNPSSMSKLIGIATRFQNQNQTEPVFVLNIVSEDKSNRENIIGIKKELEKNVDEFNHLFENLKVITRVDLNISSGIIRTAKEYMATDIVFGWSYKNTTSQRIFGGIFDHLQRSQQTLYAINIAEHLSSFTKIMVNVPQHLEHEPSFVGIIQKLIKLPNSNTHLVFRLETEECIDKIRLLLPKKSKYEIRFSLSDFNEPVSEATVLNIFFMLRKQSVSYQTKNNTAVQKIIENTENHNQIIVVPGFA